MNRDTRTISALATEYRRKRMSTDDVGASALKNDARALHLLAAAVGDIQPRNISAHAVDKVIERVRVDDNGVEVAAQTFNARVSALRGFFGFCQTRGYMSLNPLLDVKRRKDRSPERHRVPVTDFPRLIDTAQHPRDRILVVCGLWTFARGAEITSLKIKDADLVSGELYLYRTKTNDYDVLPIAEFLDRELRRWLTYYTEECGQPEEDWYLIPARKSVSTAYDERAGRFTRPLDPHETALVPTRRMGTPHRQVQAILEACGYETMREGMHTLRRSGARALFDDLVGQGYDGALKLVSSMLGHASVVMTEHYLGLREDRHRRNKQLRGKVMFHAIERADVTYLDTGKITQLHVAER